MNVEFPMSRFPLVQESSDPEVNELYRQMQEAGFGSDTTPINFFTAQGTRPDILRATWELTRGVLVEGQLPATVKQMIAMTVSSQANCRYCSVTHRGALESMGVAEEVVRSCVEDPDLAEVPEPHRAILKFALKTARDPNSITDSDYEALAERGLRNEEIMEVVMVTAFTNFINTWADASGIALDGKV